MPSVSYRRWRTVRAAALDQVESAHAALGGTGPGRRYATQQINHAYAVLLAAEYQGFCRALHGECIDAILSATMPSLRVIVKENLRLARQLDRGNATPAALGADFGRFDIRFWPALVARDHRISDWQRLLGELNDWRNAIAHNDFASVSGGGTITLKLQAVRRFRGACRRLARAFDELLCSELSAKIGRPPW